MNDVMYKISLYPSRFHAYQTKKGKKGIITQYISNYRIENFDWFVGQLIAFQLLERICLERAFQKIKLKQRCDRCPPKRIADLMLNAMILNNKGCNNIE